VGPREDICGQLKGIQDLHGRTLGEHGERALGVGWRDEATQLRRYRTLADVIDTSDPVSVNDFGCGYGGLFRYLIDDLGVDLKRYFGYDISPEMLSAARSYIADPRAELIESSTVTQDADYSIACGTLFNKLEASDETWAAYIRDTLTTLADRSGRGFAFNLMSVHVDWRDEKLYYGDPLEFFEFCRTEFSPMVALRHDYYRFEWSILVRTGSG
jgi:SAM-dependent methyltransferase